MSGANDLAGLFGRVTALEQEGADNDLTVTRITKIYGTLGIKVTFTTKIHQYKICGQVVVGQGSTSWDEMPADFDTLSEMTWDDLFDFYV